MLNKWRRWLWVTGIAASLGLGAAATAQTSGFQPFKGLFGAKAAPESKAHDGSPATKIQVELAWLGDPMTFPYYLEAHIKGANLEVHGYVPSKDVRSQAMSLAKLNCPLTVIDAMKEHASLAVNPIHRAPEQLKSAAQTALRSALPGQRLSVQCQEDGNVQVNGSVRTLEQKLKVSQALRRLHGCTSVTNLTQARAGEVVQQAPPMSKTASTPAASTSAVTKDVVEQSAAAPPAPKRSRFLGLFAKAPATPPEPAYIKITTRAPSAPANPPETKAAQKTPSPVTAGDAYETRGLVVVSSGEAPNAKGVAQAASTAPPALTTVSPTAKTAGAAPSLSAAQLKKRIEATVPGARNVLVSFTSKTDVRVECTARPGDDSGTIAGQILSVSELGPYKVDLQIQLPMSEQK